MEDYSQIPQNGPSINRKGGLRLHPIRDGVIPLMREGRMVHRDSGGNVYQEITNPSTGMCMGVTSPLTIQESDKPVLIPTPVVPVDNPKRDAGLLPQFDLATGTWYEGSGSRVRAIRTVDMGDSLLPSVPTRRGHANRKGRAPQPTRAPDGPSRPTKPTTTVPRLSNALIDAWILGTAQKKAKGKPVPTFKITPLMRRLARAEIARQADIAQYCQQEQ